MVAFSHLSVLLVGDHSSLFKNKIDCNNFLIKNPLNHYWNLFHGFNWWAGKRFSVLCGLKEFRKETNGWKYSSNEIPLFSTFSTLMNYWLVDLLNFTQMRSKPVTQGAQTLGKSWVHIPTPFCSKCVFIWDSETEFIQKSCGEITKHLIRWLKDDCT